jgi:hypothetical protein
VLAAAKRLALLPPDDLNAPNVLAIAKRLRFQLALARWLRFRSLRRISRYPGSHNAALIMIVPPIQTATG